MALVDHDQVEEAGRELAEQLLPLLVASNRLIEAEVDLISCVDTAAPVDGGSEIDAAAVVALDGPGIGRELRHDRAERPEVVHHRLVNQYVPVGEEQDPLLASGLP